MRKALTGFLVAVSISLLALPSTVGESWAQSFCFGYQQFGFCVDPGQRQAPRNSRPRTTKPKKAPTNQARAVKPKPRYAKESIEGLQTILAVLGFDPGPIDGDFGPSTVRAYKQWQQSAGLPADGQLSDAAIKVLLAQYDQAKASTATASTGGASDMKLIASVNLLTDPAASGDQTDPGPQGSSPALSIVPPPVGLAPPRELTGDFCAKAAATPGAKVAARWCAVRAHLAAAAPQGEAATTLEGLCATYAPHVRTTLAEAGILDPDQLATTLSGRFGAPEHKAAHRQYADQCIALAAASDGREEIYFFAALRYGTGDVSAAEILGAMHALGLGVGTDLGRAARWMAIAQTAAAGGAPPLAPVPPGGATVADQSAEIAALVQSKRSYAELLAIGVQVAPVLPPSAPGTLTESTRLAALYLDVRSGEIAKGYGAYEDMLGGALESEVGACREIAGRFTPADLVRSSQSGQIPADVPLLTTLQFCRAAAYMEGDLQGMVVHDHLLNVRTAGGNALDTAVHYVLANQVPADKATARSLLELGKTSADADPYTISRIDRLLESLDR